MEKRDEAPDTKDRIEPQTQAHFSNYKVKGFRLAENLFFNHVLFCSLLPRHEPNINSDVASFTVRTRACYQSQNITLILILLPPETEPCLVSMFVQSSGPWDHTQPLLQGGMHLISASQPFNQPCEQQHINTDQVPLSRTINTYSENPQTKISRYENKALTIS